MDPDSDFNPYAASAHVNPVTKSRDDDARLTVVDWLICIFCGGFGCIVGIVRLALGMRSGVKMVGLSILFAFLWWLVLFVLINRFISN